MYNDSNLYIENIISKHLVLTVAMQSFSDTSCYS